MNDYLNIGSTPYGEPCAQVGSENYQQQSAIECKVFKKQCERVLYKEYGVNQKVHITVKSFPHDFGTYREVVVNYNPEIQEQRDQAFFLESADLENWDKEALLELKTYNYSIDLES